MSSAFDRALDIAQKLEAKARERQAENAIGLEASATNSQSDKVLDATKTPVHRRGAPKGSRGLMPVHHPNRDFFFATYSITHSKMTA